MSCLTESSEFRGGLAETQGLLGLPFTFICCGCHAPFAWCPSEELLQFFLPRSPGLELVAPSTRRSSKCQLTAEIKEII